MAERLRIGVVGLGFGEHHVRTLANMGDAELVAVADYDEDRRKRVGAKYSCSTYRSAECMLKEQSLDALSLCVSPTYREPILRAAAEQGVAVFVEKPWASDLEHARVLSSICAANPAPVMSGFSFRYHPVIQRAIELVQNGLGQVELGHGAYVPDWLPDSGHWLWDPKNGGGYFNENSCHIFDIVCALAGRPVELYAYGVRRSDRPSEAAASVSLRFAAGGVVTLAVGGVGVGAVARYPSLELFTANGYVDLAGRTHIWSQLRWALRGESSCREVTAPPEQLGRTRYTDALEHFLAAVRSGGAPASTADDGVLAVAVADAVKESFRTGKPVGIEAVQ
jgi:predicted dehydrogenase